MNAWLMFGLVYAVLLAFWFFLGRLFDAIEDMQAAWREAREDASSARGTGSS